jgi:hypothetical protein
MMQVSASHLDVPEAHPKDSNAWPFPENAAGAEGRRQTVRVHSGKDKPAAAFATVRYRDCWFWVDNGDRQTKRALMVVVFFHTWQRPSVRRNCR